MFNRKKIKELQEELDKANGIDNGQLVDKKIQLRELKDELRSTEEALEWTKEQIPRYRKALSRLENRIKNKESELDEIKSRVKLETENGMYAKFFANFSNARLDSNNNNEGE